MQVSVPTSTWFSYLPALIGSFPQKSTPGLRQHTPLLAPKGLERVRHSALADQTYCAALVLHFISSMTYLVDQAASSTGNGLAESFDSSLARSCLVNFHSKGSAICWYRS